MLIGGALETKQWNKKCGVGGVRHCEERPWEDAGLFYAKDLPERKKGAMSGQQEWGPAGGLPEGTLSLGTLLCRRAAGSGGEPQAHSSLCFSSALPATFSQPRGLQQPERAEGSQGLHGNVDVKDLGSGTLPPAPTGRPVAAPALFCSS